MCKKGPETLSKTEENQNRVLQKTPLKEFQQLICLSEL